MSVPGAPVMHRLHGGCRVLPGSWRLRLPHAAFLPVA